MRKSVDRISAIKDEFHKLIDEFKDDSVLEYFFNALKQQKENYDKSDILEDLTEEQKRRLQKSYESYLAGRTHTISEVKEEVIKWLSK